MAFSTKAEILLKDIPGQLSKALAAFETARCNVQSITHFRDRKNASNEVPVEILFSAESHLQSKQLKDALELQGIAISAISEVKKVEKTTAGIVGHLVHSKSIEKIITAIDGTGANVCDLKVTMPAQEKESSTLITLEAKDKPALEKAMATLRAQCIANNLLLVEAL